MRIEAPIFDGEERVDHVRRDAIERHVDALLDEKGERRLVVPVVNDRALRVLADRRERRRVGKLACGAP